MTPIRKRISRPFLAIIILIPITIMLLFNVIVSFYSKVQAEEDLMQAVSEIEQSLMNDTTTSTLPNRPNLGQNPNIPTQNTNEDLPNMASIINNQSHSNSVELVVYNQNGELSRLFNEESFVTEDLGELIYAETETLDYNEIGDVRLGGDTYYIVEIEYETQTFSDKLVYISKGLVIDEFVTAINIVLLIVSVAVTLIALFVSTRVTNAIAKPIEHLISLVENMKSDELIVIDDRSDSLELQKLTSEINALNKRIYHYNESQKNFLASASHELRTPLMSIQGYADGIEMGVFSDAKGTAHLISDQSKRLTKLVDGLLTLARAENFNANKKLERLNISNCLSDMLATYKGYAVSSNIELKTDIMPNLFANANNELLTGSVGNIISNAIRYAKTTVSITLESKENYAIITVKDDGKGIENLDKIWSRFSKGEDGNFGLGLSIAKTSVEMMNGEVKASNDGGAVFEIRLDLL